MAKQKHLTAKQLKQRYEKEVHDMCPTILLSIRVNVLFHIMIDAGLIDEKRYMNLFHEYLEGHRDFQREVSDKLVRETLLTERVH